MKKIFAAGLMALAIAGVSSVSKAAPVKDMDLDISGLAQLSYSWSQVTGSNDGFDTARLRINLAAKPAEHVSAYASIEGTDNVSPTADSRIVDMYVDLTYLPWVSARIGQFATPNSYELNTNEYNLDTIRYSQGVGVYSMRDRGVALSGQPIKELGWVIFGLNGVGTVTGANDNNNDSALYGGQLNWQALSNLSFKLWGLSTNDTGLVAGADQKEDAIGFGGDFKYEGFHVYGELNDGNKKVAGVKNDMTEYVVTGTYTIPETGVMLVGRYDLGKSKTAGVKNADVKVATVGVNWDFEKNARVQLMREIWAGDNDNTDLLLSVKF